MDIWQLYKWIKHANWVLQDLYFRAFHFHDSPSQMYLDLDSDLLLFEIVLVVYIKLLIHT